MRLPSFSYSSYYPSPHSIPRIFLHLYSHSKSLSYFQSKIRENLFLSKKDQSQIQQDSDFEQAHSILGLNRGSTHNLKAFYIILGMSLSSIGADSSRQGLVLISMRLGLNAESMMKSSPNSSKQYSFFSFSMRQQIALTASLANSFICSCIIPICAFSLGNRAQRQRQNSLQLSLFPSQYFPQFSPVFWMASLVRWMYESKRFERSYGQEDVRIQPQSYQKTFRRPWTVVTSMYVRISNFLPLYSSKFLTQVWTISFLWVFRLALISLSDEDTTIPCPLFEFSAGFIIQIAPFFFPSANTFSNSIKLLGFVFSRQQVGGTILDRSFFKNSQYMEMLQQRAFLLPNMQFCQQWLWSSSGAWMRQRRMADFLGVRVEWYLLSCFQWKIWAREASLSLDGSVWTVVVDFLQEDRMRLLLWSVSDLSSSNGRKSQHQLSTKGWTRSITYEILSWDQTKFAFESWLVSVHQLRLRRMERMRLLLFPLPTKQQYLLLTTLPFDLLSVSIAYYGGLRSRQQWQELSMISRHQNILCNL